MVLFYEYANVFFNSIFLFIKEIFEVKCIVLSALT